GALPELVPGFVERHGVRVGVAGLQPRERAEQTAGDADVGRFDADVVVVERAGAVPLLALAIGEPADEQEIVGLEQTNSIGEVESNAAVKLFCDIGDAGGAKAGLHRPNSIYLLIPHSWIRPVRARGPCM